jgi:TonB family protein
MTRTAQNRLSKNTAISRKSLLGKCLLAGAAVLFATSVFSSTAFARQRESDVEPIPTEAEKRAAKNAEKNANQPVDPQWTDYMNELQSQIVGKWFPPSGQDVYKPVAVEIRVRKDGKLSKADIVLSSQIPDVDRAARKAVLDAAPFKAFPAGVKGDFARFELKFDQVKVDRKESIIRKL